MKSISIPVLQMQALILAKRRFSGVGLFLKSVQAKMAGDFPYRLASYQKVSRLRFKKLLMTGFLSLTL